MTKTKSLVLLAIVFACAVLLYLQQSGWLNYDRMSASQFLDRTAALTNPDFEQQAAGWKFYFDESDGKVIEDSGGNGTRCVRLKVGPHHQLDGLSQAINPLDSRVLTFTGHLAAQGSDIKAWLHIECVDGNDLSEENQYGQLAVSDSIACPLDGKWSKISTSITIPPDTTHIQVFACVEGTNGHALFDDFSIDRQD